MEPGASVSSICQLIETGDDEDAIKRLVARVTSDQVFRREIAAEPEIWASLGKIGLEGQRLKLANNLSACKEAGIAACCHRRAFVLASSSGDRVVWQILANFFKGSPFVDYDLDWVAAFGGSANLPALVLLRDIICEFPATVKDLASQGVFSLILSKVTHWFEHDNLMQVMISTFKSIISSPNFKCVFYSTLEFSETLMRLVDGILALPEPIPHDARSIIECVVNTAPVEVVINAIDLEQRQRAVKQWVLMMCEFDIIERIGHETPELLKQLLHPIVKLLVVSKKLPRRDKLRYMQPEETALNNDSDFVGTKTSTLTVLAILLFCDSEASNVVRELGGLPAILECCVIDANQPYMKERAILCLRYLLQNNYENQSIVAGLEARRLADPDALAQCGYEADITNGQISLKRVNR